MSLSGFTYSASELPRNSWIIFKPSTFLLAKRAKWVVVRFQSESESDLRSFMQSHIDKWGAEFAQESLFRECIE